MKVEESYYLWNKGDIYPINKYFKTNEFACQCKHKECVEQKISVALIAKLTELRELVNEPLTITSGFRCEQHQADLRKNGVNTVVASKSTHELGDAADVKPARTPIKNFEQLAAKYFKAIGIAKNFLHLDLRDDKVRRWDY